MVVQIATSQCEDARPKTQAQQAKPEPLDSLTTQKLRSPTLRANPFPKVTDLICRLPLSTLFYQLEAVHLEDLMRLWVRLDWTLKSLLVFQGSLKEHRIEPKNDSTLPLIKLFRRAIRFHSLSKVLKRKDNSSQVFCQRHQVPLRRR